MTNPKNPKSDELLKKLLESVARHPIPKNRVEEISAALSEAQYPITGFDICTIGTCIDHRWDGNIKDINIGDFLDSRFGPVKGIEIFPEGTLAPDLARIRTVHAL